MISHSVLEEDFIMRAVLTLRASYAALPNEAEMEDLVTDSLSAEKKGIMTLLRMNDCARPIPAT